MFFPSNLSINLTIIVALVCVIGDYLTSLSKATLTRALCDNITHAVIGGLCWSITYLNRDKSTQEPRMVLLEIICCSIISSFIDLDHFVAAKSVLLKDATNLKHRPLLHCSTIPLVVFAILLLLSYGLQHGQLKRGALILLTAFATHHLRDAARRGLWFYPYGSTVPLPYALYVILSCFVPYFIALVDRRIVVSGFREVRGYSHVI